MGIPKATVLLGSFSATTAGTVAISDNYGGIKNGAVWCDVTAVGAGSEWTLTARHVWPSGNVQDITTGKVITGTASSDILALATTAYALPEITHLYCNCTTAGTTTSIAGKLYIVSSD